MKKFVLRFIVWACLISVAAADQPAGPAQPAASAEATAGPAAAPPAPAKKKKRKRKKKKPSPDASGVPSDQAPATPPAK